MQHCVVSQVSVSQGISSRGVLYTCGISHESSQVEQAALVKVGKR